MIQSMPINKFEIGILCGQEHEFLMDITQVLEPSFSLMNMRIFDKEHVQKIYECLQKKLSAFSLILLPMLYYDIQSKRHMDFNLVAW